MGIDSNIKMEEEIITIISEALKLPRSEIKPGMNLWDDLGMREMDLVEITLELEEKFGIEIDDDDFGKVKRVVDVINYIKKKMNGKS